MGSYNFVNPYNFISLPKKKDAAGREDRSLTGVIDYIMMTKTPLFIPNTSNDHVFFLPRAKDEDHKSYDFFSYTDLSSHHASKHFAESIPKPPKPVIPGSEMRGLIRSNFEILTNSCLSALDDREVLSKRTMQSFEAGVLERREDKKFDLLKAEDCLWRTKGPNDTTDELNWKNSYYTRKCYKQQSLHEGQKVFFTIKKRDKGKPLASQINLLHYEGAQEGYLILGEDGPEIKTDSKELSPQKHCAHIFMPRNLIKQNVDLNLLFQNLTQYNNNAPEKHPYREYKEMLEKFKSGQSQEKYFPVYYSLLSKDCLFLSPACKTRDIYSNVKLPDLAGTLKPCTDKEDLCPACSLFGTLLTDSAVASRVRFSDLGVLENQENLFLAPITLKPLSSPKISNTEFYLKRPDGAVFWTYEYYLLGDGTLKVKNAELAGRKFYWHNPSVNNDSTLMGKKASDYNAEIQTNQNITVRPVRKDVKFSGKIYFKNISREELNVLIYTLEAGDLEKLDKKNHGYKLGSAKPLGMGSIVGEVTEVTLRKYVFDEANHTVSLKEEKADVTDMVRKAKVSNEKGLYAVTALDAVQEGVIDYPHPLDPKTCDQTNDIDSNHIFDWFTQNHGAFIRKKKDHTIQPTKSPNARDEVYFKEYMEPQDGDTNKAITKLNTINFEEIVWPSREEKKHENIEQVKKVISVPVRRYRSEVIKVGQLDKKHLEFVKVKQVLPKYNFDFSVYRADCQCNFKDLKNGTKVEFEIEEKSNGVLLAKHVRIAK